MFTQNKFLCLKQTSIKSITAAVPTTQILTTPDKFLFWS